MTFFFFFVDLEAFILLTNARGGKSALMFRPSTGVANRLCSSSSQLFWIKSSSLCHFNGTKNRPRKPCMIAYHHENVVHELFAETMRDRGLQSAPYILGKIIQSRQNTFITLCCQWETKEPQLWVALMRWPMFYFDPLNTSLVLQLHECHFHSTRRGDGNYIMKASLSGISNWSFLMWSAAGAEKKANLWQFLSCVLCPWKSTMACSVFLPKWSRRLINTCGPLPRRWRCCQATCSCCVWDGRCRKQVKRLLIKPCESSFPIRLNLQCNLVPL